MSVTENENQFLNLTKEADEILISKSLKISTIAKYKYERSFFKSLELKRLLGNYMIPLGLLAAVIVGITVFLFLYLFEIEKYWMYILLITCGVLLTIVITWIGFQWKRSKKNLKRREMKTWFIKRFLIWSKREIKKELNCNKKRFLLENMLNIYKKFGVTFEEIRELKNAENNDAVKVKISCEKIMSDVINDSENLPAIYLICILFKKVFKMSDRNYELTGSKVAKKLLKPMLEYTTCDKLKTEILGIVRDFCNEKDLNETLSNVGSTMKQWDQQILLQKSEIEKGEIDKKLIDYEFFEDLWMIDDAIMDALRKEHCAYMQIESIVDTSQNKNILAMLSDSSVKLSFLNPTPASSNDEIAGNLTECVKLHVMMTPIQKAEQLKFQKQSLGVVTTDKNPCFSFNLGSCSKINNTNKSEIMERVDKTLSSFENLLQNGEQKTLPNRDFKKRNPKS